MATIHTATFGLSVPGRTVPVSEDEWNLFLVEQVCPLLPSFSVREELGFWQGEPEPCKVITVIAPHGAAPVIDAQLRQVARLWAVAFEQEAVLVTSQPIGALLVTATETERL